VNGTTHLIAGVACGLALTRAQGVTDPLMAAAVVVVASGAALMPDWVQINVPALGKTFRGVFGHRGISHWLLTAAAVYFAVAALYPARSGAPLALASLAGYVSHILLDAFNAPGVPAFWPLPWRLRLATFKSGGWFDGVARFCAGLLALWGALRFIP